MRRGSCAKCARVCARTARWRATAPVYRSAVRFYATLRVRFRSRRGENRSVEARIRALANLSAPCYASLALQGAVMTMPALEGQARRLGAKRAPNLSLRDGVSAGADRESSRRARMRFRRALAIVQRNCASARRQSTTPAEMSFCSMSRRAGSTKRSRDWTGSDARFVPS